MRNHPARPTTRRWRLLLLAGLLLVGFGLTGWQPLSLREVMAWGGMLAEHPAAVPLLIALQALLLALALPGTLMLWMIAPFYPPVTATIMLTLGSTLGALGAYLISAWLGDAWQPGPRGGRLKSLLARQSDLPTQLALRVLPGFPHSVVNYAAGTLGLALPTFLLAAVLGLAIKWSIYASAVHGLVQAGLGREELDWTVLAPLVILALLLLAGRAVKQRFERNRGD